MNVLLLCSQFYPHQGGVESAVQNLGIALRRLGHKVVVATSLAPRNLAFHEDVLGLPVYRYFLGLPFKTLRSTLAFPFFSLKTLVAIIDLIRRENIEVLNFHFVDDAALYVCLLKRLCGVKVVVSLHGNDVQRFPKESAWSLFILRRLLNAADGITVNSQYLLEEAEKVTGLDLQRAVVVGNGIDLKEFENVMPYKSGSPYVLSLCRLVYKKGVDILIESWSQILSILPTGIALYIVGDGEERQNLEKLILKLNLEDRVRMLGLIKDRDKVLSLFKGAVLYVVPSRIEPFGIVVLEAMASGTPVLASNTGGIPSIIEDGVNGSLFENENVADLSKRLVAALNNPGKMKIRAIKALQDVQIYTWQHVAERFIKVYERSSKP